MKPSYFINTATDAGELVRQVNEAIAAGYIPSGSMVIETAVVAQMDSATLRPKTETYYYQPMILKMIVK